MLQQRLAAVGGPDRHGIEARQLLSGAVAGLEAAVGVRGRPESACLLEAPLPALCQFLVVLEFLCIVLEHPELGGGLRLHVLGRRVHGLVRARVVGLCGVGHVVVPLASAAGHLAREVLLQRLDGAIHHRCGIPVLRPLRAVHRLPWKRRLQCVEFPAFVRGHHVIAFLLHQLWDRLRGRPCHRLCVLVRQRSGDGLPGEDVRDHEAVLLGTPGVLGEVDQIGLQAVVGALRRALSEAPRLWGQHLPGHVAPQGFPRPVHRHCGLIGELALGDLIELPRVPHIEVSGQPAQQVQRRLLSHLSWAWLLP